jgi:hypothetical protein
MANGENPAFDELMSQMGVRRLEQGPKSVRKGRKGRKSWGKGGQPSGKAARMVAQGPSSAPPPPAPSAPAVVVTPPPTPAPVQAAPPPAVELDALRAELRAAREDLQRTRDRADATEAERVRLKDERDLLDAERRGLQRRLQAATGDTPPPMPSLGEALKERGLLGELEAGKALTALVAARRVGALLSMLEATDGPSLRAFLDDRVVLHCGGEDCPTVPGRAIVTVPKPRCEVCAGSDIQRSVRRFVDACLLTGQRHVLIVGGSPKYHRQLRDLVQHHRLRLELVPGNVRRNARQAQADMARADVVIIWGGTLLDHAVADLYKDGPARVLRIAHRGIGRMLELAAEAVDRPPAAGG